MGPRQTIVVVIRIVDVVHRGVDRAMVAEVGVEAEEEAVMEEVAVEAEEAAGDVGGTDRRSIRAWTMLRIKASDMRAMTTARTMVIEHKEGRDPSWSGRPREETVGV